MASTSARWSRQVVLSVMVVVTVGCGGRSNGNGPSDGVVPITDDGSTDGSAGCGLVTCASQGATCGPVGDGCGGVIDCGSCTAPESCGGGGTLFTCGGGSGSGTCTPRTCAQAGATCGVVSDGCGGVTANCGSCAAGSTCGGGLVPNTCAATACTGLCLQQDACTNMSKTTITGTVTAPGHTNTAVFGNPDPIYGALVYVPNDAVGAPTYGVAPFTQGVSCDSCSSLVTGSPLVSVTTGVDGTFTLNNAPCGTNIPLVIQLGRWRRQITIPSVACCAQTTLTNTQTHLPRNKVGEPGDLKSDIPLMAFSTGNVDALHCVLRKIGIDDSEFTNPNGTGRVRFYADNGAKINGSTPAASTLYGNATELAKYDMALFECVGNRVTKSAADRQRVIDYANVGGRVFATHFSYVWLTNSDGTAGSSTAPKPWFQTADWLVNQGNFDGVTGLVDQTVQGDPATQTRRIAFASWLKLVGASTTLGQIVVNVVRNDFNSVNSAAATMLGTPAQQWLSASTPFSGPLHYTFDTPISYAPDPAPTTQCGRVLYSDFHVSDARTGGATFPTECTDGLMTPQEKTLEFMLFDLASCVGPPAGSCAPKTCANLGYTCGQSGDGCDDGVVLDCGSCATGQTCGGGGAGTCGTGSCTPRTCADAGAQCGTIGDGCGGTVDCGTCSLPGQSCGGGGANVCGNIIL
ncbi:MAG: Tryptophan synthase alpha chain [Deltaproteobacteria bacterium]|nr:Tryptophan synthase alpha chain [Deltaproteobacteria bacterium]